ncbi:MerR family transcriptional regulator [Brevibacillus nitrificans]|uniref:helix-turn-helix domain-containing protein n=1 Tax=Brevibacillus nitrificans TaxID=651560 RepID=UPI00261351E6|nr:MerR family transcriptional regulator [Brevibacillus nitrificans]MED1795258.1 MerR family transcriptional regulator [Brevibacillus nitrificans]
MSFYKIEEVAKECGLTKRTIRYYEEIGLLFPPERSDGGYRMYTDRHIEQLKKIISARDVLGFSLPELVEFIQMSDSVNSQRVEAKQTEDIQKKLEKVAELEETLEKQLRMIDLKLEKIKQFRLELVDLQERVEIAKTKYTAMMANQE